GVLVALSGQSACAASSTALGLMAYPPAVSRIQDWMNMKESLESEKDATTSSEPKDRRPELWPAQEPEQDILARQMEQVKQQYIKQKSLSLTMIPQRSNAEVVPPKEWGLELQAPADLPKIGPTTPPERSSDIGLPDLPPDRRFPEP
ncbi:hypothetical protein BIW11_09822, partial [Tropilaelaps mercedesae]